MSSSLHRTVLRLTWRSLVGRRRGLLLLLLPVTLVGLAALIRALAGDGGDASEAVLDALGLSLLVPLVALVAGTGVLSPEVDDGSILYLLAKPVPRRTIVVSKVAVAVACVAVVTVVSVLAAALVVSPTEPRTALGYAAGALAGAVAYTALFVLLSVLTRHAVVVGLVYVLIWEGLLGGLLDGIRWLSITRWSSAVAAELSGDAGLSTDLGVGYAAVALAVVTVLALWLAGERLRSFRLTGEE